MRALFVCLALTAFGCSVQESSVHPDPATAVTVEAAAAPIDAPKHVKFHFGVSRHHSCSLSWETSSDWGDYELTLTPPHTAKLTYERHRETSFGSNGKLGATTNDLGSSKRSLEGTVARVGDALRLELHDAGTTCASLDTPCSTMSMTCKAAKVTIVEYDDAGKHDVLASALRCTPAFGLPDELVEKGADDALLFGDAHALMLDLTDYGGFGNVVGPQLRASTFD